VKKIKTLAVVLLAVAIVFSTSACKSNTPTPSSSTATDDKSPITLTIAPTGFSLLPDGVTHNAVLDQITKDTGVTLSYVDADQTKFAVLASSNSLPDIFQDDSNGKYKQTISSGQAIDLTSLVDKYAPNIKRTASEGLNNAKAMFGNDKKIYGIPPGELKADPAHPLIPNKNSFIGLFARYDIYQAVGSPKIATGDDYLNVLKQMQVYQQNKVGKASKIYALSGWTDWGQWPWTLGYSQSFLNVDIYTDSDAFCYDCATGNITDAMDTNSAFWQTYAWYNKAYQMGLVDPEGLTQNFSQYQAKVTAGTVIAGPSGFYQPDTKVCGDNAALYVLPGTPYVTQITPMVNPGNPTLAWCISNNCKNPVRAMKFLDYCYSDKGQRLIANGVEGKDWSTINGVPQLIGNALAVALNGTQDYNKQEGIGQTGLPALSSSYILSDGYPVLLSSSAEQIGLTATKADKNFVTSLNTAKKALTYPGQIYDQWAKDGLTKATDGYPSDIYYFSTLDTSLTATSSACGTYFNSVTAKIIMAKDDATFASVKAEVIAKMKSLGSEKIFTDAVNRRKDADVLMAKTLGTK
jgi:putative aldouronate transport system substrate-binding protein